MSQVIVNDLIDHFEDKQWVTGLDSFLVPAKVAVHTIDCLDYYFSGKTGDVYQWGYRFGDGWWELPDDRLPSKADALAVYHGLQGGSWE